MLHISMYVTHLSVENYILELAEYKFFMFDVFP